MKKNNELNLNTIFFLFIQRESFGILIPEYAEVSELDLVSEKTAELFFSEWLEREPSEEFMAKIFTEELENREFF